MALFDDLVHSSGASYFYDLEEEPGVVDASGAGAEASSSASSATVLTGSASTAIGTGGTVTTSASSGSVAAYALVTITGILNAPGSIFYGWDEGWANWEGSPPQPGDTIQYETRNGFRIAPNGEVEADEYGTYTYLYNDGTGWVERSVTIDASVQVFAAGATATTTAADASLYGGVNIAGDLPEVTATPSTGGGTAGNIATGAGVEAGATAAGASATAGAAASGAAPEVVATPADAVGENILAAEGAGVEVAATPADATASGDVFAVGDGSTAVATAATGAGVGDRLPGSIPYTVITTIYPRTVLIARAAA